MTQKEIDKLIAQTMPQIQALVNLSETDYIMLRYEIGVRWLTTTGFTPMQQMIISKCDTYWAWFHVIYLGCDRKILRNRKRYRKLSINKIREQYIITHLEAMPDKIPHAPMFDIMIDARNLVKVKQLMHKVRERLSKAVECNYDAIKKDARQMWQDINRNIIIDDEIWNMMWKEMEQTIKAYNDKNNPDDIDFMEFVGQTINNYMPEEIPKRV